MPKERKCHELGDIQIVRLRNDIVLNSLFVDDYRNRYRIDPEEVYDFFAGYFDYLCELERENGEDLPFNEFLKKYDTRENLISWRDCVACGAED